MWTFPGTPPSCSWYNDYSGSGGGSSSGSSGSSSSGSGSGGSGSSSGSGGSSNGGGSGSSGSGSGGGSNNNDNGSSGSGSGGDSGGGSNGNQQNYENVADGNNGGDGGGDPFSDFDISVCESYESLWLWDLSMSCDDSLIGCNCTFAAELIDDGLLSCEDASLCPQECQVCVAMVIIMMTVYYSRRRKDQQDLKASLMAEENLAKLGAKEEGNGMMYINGDMPWHPPGSHAGLTEQTLQPVSTMSTTASQSFFEGSRIQAFGGESLLGGKDKSTSDSNEDEEYNFAPPMQTAGIDETGIISPISTPGVSIDGEEGDGELENSAEGPSMLDDSLDTEN
ncbi:MAG: hypothetical protein SGILL_001280 [Bacillariaceae sp.]